MSDFPKLPVTDSVRELASFWDEHDLTDFEAQLEEVDEPVFDRGVVLEVRLDEAEVEVLRRMAKSIGLSDDALIRKWILERLDAA